MDCRVWSQVIAFGGALTLCIVLCTSLTKNSCNKVVFNHFDRDSYVGTCHLEQPQDFVSSLGCIRAALLLRSFSLKQLLVTIGYQKCGLIR